MSDGPKCPICGSDMVERNGRYGKFLGCSEFPECDGTRSLNEWTENNNEKTLQENMQIIDTDDWLENIVYGAAVSIYGDSSVGKAVSNAKYYENTDFPDELLELSVNVFKKRYGERKFDLLVYVPPTRSGKKVKRFAEKLGAKLGIKISHDSYKTREIKLQKSFDTIEKKRHNVKGAFAYRNMGDIKGKTILVFDDVVGSGSTLKEICEYLIKNGAKCVSPFVIAKTCRGM